jgi:hypothetical protein
LFCRFECYRRTYWEPESWYERKICKTRRVQGV